MNTNRYRARTATVTWITYENYGTYLQAYALQQTLLKLGVDNHIIDDKRIIDTCMWKSKMIKAVNIFLGRHNSSSYYKAFKRKYLRVDNNFSTLDDLNERYDAFICGSDQIWSPYLPFQPYYYLDFVKCRKIAYAPSTGTGYMTTEYKQAIKPLIERFSAVGVREESGKQMLSTFINKEISTVLDPTLLLTGSEWNRSIEGQSEKNEDYILCYFLTPNIWYMNYVKMYAQKHQLPIKIFATSKQYASYADECIYAGPKEFLSYIKGARKVFTDSFHASIFSIQFHKDFITFKRFEDGKGKDQNARIADLFHKIGLSSYFIGRESLKDVTRLLPPEYDKVDTCLNALREKSLEFLQNALKK